MSSAQAATILISVHVMWVYTLIATVLGGIGTSLSIYNVWYARREPVRRNQAALRAELDAKLEHIEDMLDKPRRVMEDRMTGRDLGARLDIEARELDKLARPLLAPTPINIGKISAQLRAINAIWSEFPNGDVPVDQRLHAKAQLDLAARYVVSARQGLMKIEQGAIRHKAQFKALRS